jgi:hypothetical protein
MHCKETMNKKDSPKKKLKRENKGSYLDYAFLQGEI